MQVMFKLRHVSLDELSISYSAISYCWGLRSDNLPKFWTEGNENIEVYLVLKTLALSDWNQLIRWSDIIRAYCNRRVKLWLAEAAELHWVHFLI